MQGFRIEAKFLKVLASRITWRQGQDPGVSPLRVRKDGLSGHGDGGAEQAIRGGLLSVTSTGSRRTPNFQPRGSGRII
jgi:hypothetical protein